MIIYELPIPPSTNNLFPTQSSSNRRYVSREYRQWRGDAGRMMMAQGPLKTLSGPVIVAITIRDEGPGDLDNRCKAILDFLVHHGVIEDDNRKIVRAINLSWGEVEGARVEISAAPEFVTRRGLAKRESAT
jgi:Holliday junction resolvase RusA-like endonuclease